MIHSAIVIAENAATDQPTIAPELNDENNNNVRCYSIRKLIATQNRRQLTLIA